MVIKTLTKEELINLTKSLSIPNSLEIDYFYDLYTAINETIKEIISNKHSDPIIRLAFKNICSLFFSFGLIYGYFYKRN